MTEYVDPEQALAAAARLGLHVRDEGLLFSALARPAASAFGEDAYPTLDLKAAALMHSVARNHALFDGNKRFSWYLTLAFLALNGFRVVMPEDTAFDLVLGVARGDLELDAAGSVIRAHLVAR
ncbi:type II toxin-antitoxin system death-on-curing family toxin [Galbitalea sp. SE-J8]|uniref:type II toxin-antitoxin system death-on-curing family toxin n=1 Tax=Galbitalea sp. SE-J8 TaxID=3054952 RepID=UPI00259C6869|nr:type II toxin-antitoxin system death-on-curing family toxin [Galbitalea sp. SE-J8]MDM4764102.1 type II toxin-antitoxin system death-on-curing family toxin [Galbitalea sp. SE-J8]